MKKALKFIGILALLALIAIQFIRPDRNDGGYETVIPFENETKPSVQVAAILKENCYDCTEFSSGAGVGVHDFAGYCRV